MCRKVAIVLDALDPLLERRGDISLGHQIVDVLYEMFSFTVALVDSDVHEYLPAYQCACRVCANREALTRLVVGVLYVRGQSVNIFSRLWRGGDLFLAPCCIEDGAPTAGSTSDPFRARTSDVSPTRLGIRFMGNDRPAGVSPAEATNEAVPSRVVV